MVHLRHRNLLQTMAATIFPPFYRHRAAREQYFRHFIVTARRGNNILAFLSSPRGAGTIFSRFIVTARRGNNISAVLSSPRGAETIFLSFYRHRAARERYFCCFIVTARRGNNILAFLSSPRGAGTIFLPFYRHRAAREQYFYLSVLAVLLQIHSRTVLAFAGQLRASRNVARAARGWRRASCRGENEKQPSEIE